MIQILFEKSFKCRDKFQVMPFLHLPAYLLHRLTSYLSAQRLPQLKNQYWCIAADKVHG